MSDFFFHYKNIGRFILCLKYSNKMFHHTDIAELKKLNVYFNIKNATDLNSKTFLSSFFFLNFYFGVLPYFTNYKYEFKLNVEYYSFLIEYIYYDKRLFSVLYYFTNDVFYIINKVNLLLEKSENYWVYSVKDMNFFLEKRNSLGFFYLKHNLNLKLCFKNNLNNIGEDIFYLFKLKV